MGEQLQIDFTRIEHVITVTEDIIAEERQAALDRSLQIDPVNALQARLKADRELSRTEIQHQLDLVSPNPRTRFEAEHAHLMPDPDLVKPDEAPRKPPVQPRHVRRPDYYNEDGTIKSSRLSSKEKMLGDGPTVPQPHTGI